MNEEIMFDVDGTPMILLEDERERVRPQTKPIGYDFLKQYFKEIWIYDPYKGIVKINLDEDDMFDNR